MDFVFTTTQTSNDFVFDSSNDTFTDLTFQGGTYAQGIQGEKGETGEGVPTGGTTNQALTKTDGTDYNTQWSTVDKSFVGLGNVDNTSDADKPVSTAQQTALDAKVNKAGDTMTGNLLPSPTDTHTLGNAANKWLSATVSTVATGNIISNDTASLVRISGGTQDNGAVMLLGGSTHTSIANTGAARIGATGIWNWSVAGLYPNADSTYTLGTSALYWSNTYTDRLYLNSTAYLDGATAGALAITGLLGLGTTAPTHTLTLPSTSTGIAIYNTADQTTNYERVRQYWSSNVYTIAAEKGGTGTDRAIRIGTIGATFYAQVNPGSAPAIFQVTATTGNAVGVGSLVNPTFTSTGAGTVVGMSISPIMTTGGTNGYTALLINPTESTTGSGAKLLIDAQVGGVSKFKVDNTGKITTALSQTYTATNVTTDRSYDANATTLDEVADVLGTLIADLRAVGVVK